MRQYSSSTNTSPTAYSEVQVFNLRRNRDSPPLYEIFNHPQMSTLKARGNRRCFVYVVDTSKSGMKKARQVEKDLPLPLGNDAAARQAGRYQAS